MSKHIQEVLNIHAAQAISDKDILGKHLQAQDQNADYLQGNSTYAVYSAIANYYKPKYIAEIGFRFGYSLKAMIVGALHHHRIEDLQVRAMDNLSYEGPECLEVTVAMLKDMGMDVDSGLNCTVAGGDTQNCADLGFPPGVDMFHVDGDHSIQGCYNDLLWAKKLIKDDGVILVDDMDADVCPGVRAAVLLFVGDYDFTFDYYPTYRGLAAIYREQ